MLEIYFITSSKEKLAHLRYLTRDFALKILKQKQYGIGYEEPRIKDRSELLEKSIYDAAERFSKNVSAPHRKFFFIEDTSVRIEALSTENNEVPGVDVKYWMRANTFRSIDDTLKMYGNNRKVSVRSDIVLWLPENLQKKVGKEYVHFFADVKGQISEKDIPLNTQPFYPWLDNRTFNKWFVPSGYSDPISMLDIEDANRCDFRAGAVNQTLEFLSIHGFLQKKSEKLNIGTQLGFAQPYVFLICGQTCAGKTTLAQHLQENYPYYHIEASDFMYLNYYERHGWNSDVNIGEFALEALNSNKKVVVDRVLEHINDMRKVPLVITGFRAPEEIYEFRKGYHGVWKVREVWIDADLQERFERSIKRGRQDKVYTKPEFEKRDQLQNRMGLQSIRNSLPQELIIDNKTTIEDFYEEFDQQHQKPLSNARGIDKNQLSNSLFRRKSLEHAVLMALLNEDNSKFFTTTEIAHLINALPEYLQNPKSKNNVSRYFNQSIHPYYEIKANKEGKASYRLTNTGVSRALWIKSNKAL